ncbi:MAG: PEGA domain-containing protein [Spirochaetaceae bacterium]|jgi:hypothetical protein|nr:PEGA domain-containing protein [Spirochaetaceae bacterium]
MKACGLMPSAPCVVFAVLLAAVSLPLFARGKTDTAAAEPLNKEWCVVITRADTSRLPPARSSIGSVWDRGLYRSLGYLQFRARTDAEVAYYAGAEWLKGQTAAAKTLKTKQAERDALYFRPLAPWQYKQQLKKIDVEIAKLRETLVKAEAAVPSIEKTPRFKVKSPGAEGEFPPPPAAGSEALFCSREQADAFITSVITLYHERIYIEIKLWSLYSKAYTYSDSVIFSLEDINEASGELTARLVDAMTGLFPTNIRVHTTPENAVIVTDGQFAGQGSSGVVPHSPGQVEVSAFAPGYETAKTTVDVQEGDLTGIALQLTPVPQLDFSVQTKTGEEAAVYSGALYSGGAPVRIADSVDKNMYVNVITPAGKTAGAVFKMTDAPLILNPKPPPKKGRVERARKGFYGAWGRLWVILPLTWLAVGVSDAYTNAFNTTSGNRTTGQLETAQYLYWGAGAAGILAGTFLLESLARFLWYGYQADKPATPLDVYEEPVKKTASKRPPKPAKEKPAAGKPAKDKPDAGQPAADPAPDEPAAPATDAPASTPAP